MMFSLLFGLAWSVLSQPIEINIDPNTWQRTATGPRLKGKRGKRKKRGWGVGGGGFRNVMESPFAFVGSFVCRWNLPSPSVSWTRHRRLPVGGPVCFYFGRKLLNSFCWFLISEYIALQVNLFPVLCILARYSMVKMVFFSSHARIVDKVNEPFSVCAFCCWESRDQFARTSSTQMGQGSVHGATANSNDCG